MSGQGTTGNVIAAVCSFFIPGLGQLVQGRLLAAAFYFVFCAVSYALVVTWPIGAILHLFAILSAAMFKPRD